MQSEFSAGQTWLVRTYLSIRASFWFVPLLCVFLAVGLALATLQFDETETSSLLIQWMQLPLANATGARQILGTIAGSIITIAGLVLSLTFVALTLMSQQFGPRILLIYMKDRPTQFVIGLFVGSFLFALFVLGAVGTGEFDGFVPHFSVYTAGLLAVSSFLGIIFFVHHMAVTIQADTVVGRLGSELKDAVSSALLVNADPDKPEDVDNSVPKPPSDASLVPIFANDSGFVQLIDYQTAVEHMQEADGQVWYDCRPGHFVIEGARLARMKIDPEDKEAIQTRVARTVHLSSKRTQAQYAEFELNALVEVCLRALSPGINDPYTAIACINQISDALSVLMKGRMRSRIWHDDDDRIRVIAYPRSLAHYFDSAFHPIRHALRGNPQVFIHIAGALKMLTGVACDEEQRDIVRSHAEIFIEDAAADIANPTDRDHVCATLAEVSAQCGDREK